MSSCSTRPTAAGSLRATSGRPPCRSTSPSSSSAPIRTSWNSARPTAERRHTARQRSTPDPLPCKLQEGDASCLLFLGSRLAPPAGPRRVVTVPELAACDMSTSDGTQRAIEVVLVKAAAGEMALDDAELLLRGLERRLAVAETASRAEAYEAAARALAGRHGGPAARI